MALRVVFTLLSIAHSNRTVKIRILAQSGDDTSKIGRLGVLDATLTALVDDRTN